MYKIYVDLQFEQMFPTIFPFKTFYWPLKKRISCFIFIITFTHFVKCTLLFKSALRFHFQKIIQTYVKTPILHCYFGTLLPADIDPKTKYVYILRKGTAKIGLYRKFFTRSVETFSFFFLSSCVLSIIN